MSLFPPLEVGDVSIVESVLGWGRTKWLLVISLFYCWAGKKTGRPGGTIRPKGRHSLCSTRALLTNLSALLALTDFILEGVGGVQKHRSRITWRLYNYLSIDNLLKIFLYLNKKLERLTL